MSTGLRNASAMGKKKSEVRKHTAMIRVDEAARDRAMLAASMMKMSLADYATLVLNQAADRDITREAKKLAGGSDPKPSK